MAIDETCERSRWVRDAVVVVGASVFLLVSTGFVAAAPPYKQEIASNVFVCEFSTPLGIATLGADDNGIDSFYIWSGDPWDSEVVHEVDWEQPVDATIDFAQGDVAMSFAVLPEGEVAIIGSLTHSRHYVTTLNFDILSNTAAHWQIQRTEYAFVGSISLPGVVGGVALGPADCDAREYRFSTIVNDPAANRVRGWLDEAGRTNERTVIGSCVVANADGDTAEISLNVRDIGSPNQGEFQLALGVTVNDAGGARFQGGSYSNAQLDGMFQGDLIDLDTFEEAGTSFALSLVDLGRQYEYTLKSNTSQERIRVTIFGLVGDLDTPLGSFNLGSCTAVEQEVNGVFTQPAGPPPGGKQPTNDLLSGAITVNAGYRATVATKGANEAGEVDAPCLPLPIAYSVWYRVAGTGSPITVDTTGSDFDTAIAVYTGTPVGSANTSCVDDVPLQPVGRTLQAAATFETIAGTSYWVQIGGLAQFANAFGGLKVEIK